MAAKPEDGQVFQMDKNDKMTMESFNSDTETECGEKSISSSASTIELELDNDEKLIAELFPPEGTYKCGRKPDEYDYETVKKVKKKAMAGKRYENFETSKVKKNSSCSICFLILTLDRWFLRM